MKIFISQSNYIPWKGYFDAIQRADVFVLYDDMQYTKGDWRNRNKIKTPGGLQWLTIPVKVKGRFDQKINDTEVSDQQWPRKHWKSIAHNYNKAPFFQEYAPIVEALYESAADLQNLSQINYHFLTAIAGMLGIKTRFCQSYEFSLQGDKNEKLLHICQALKATHYISGPAAMGYLNKELFEQNGIEVIWMDNSGYPEYPQLFGSFEHAVTILDMLFNTGPATTSYLKFFP
ncbi:MAG: WbqC family protein [Bacteroidia bacterium]|nr:WbqC family protein [Bacteroidia bacterium]